MGVSPWQGHYYTGQHTQQMQTSITRVGFEPTIPLFELMKIFCALELEIKLLFSNII
jgi:hypothetical protein